MNRRVFITVVTALTALALTACGAWPNEDGKIREREEGRNGVKVEVQDGDSSDDTIEHYLIPETECDEGDYLRDCADADDFLVRQPGAVPGLNRDRDDRDD